MPWFPPLPPLRGRFLWSNDMTYIEKLKDPRWQRKRLQILERDNWTCRSCGDNQGTLHVHHMLYIKNLDPWDYKDGAYQTLCDYCHEEWHEVKLHVDVWCAQIPANLFIELNGYCGPRDGTDKQIKTKLKHFIKHLTELAKCWDTGDQKTSSRKKKEGKNAN
jgi:hypothetical protein